MGACCSKSDVQGGKFVGVSGNGDAAVLDSAGAAVGVRQNSFSLAASSGRWMKFGSLRKRNSSGYYEDNDLPINRQVNVAGKMCMNGASNVACLYTQQGKKGTNQDAMVVWEHFRSRADTVFCGVFDGHGPFGHFVARKVRDSLPAILCSQWNATSNPDQRSIADSNNEHAPEGTTLAEPVAVASADQLYDTIALEENEKVPEKYLPLKQSILKAFSLTDKELKLHPNIDCFCSGTTAVTLVKQGQDLVLGNVGDSRAVLGTRDEGNSLIAVQLTVDLKPDLPREAARIQECKGRVFALQDEPEVARVWLPNSDSPGLAMARAFGDFCLKDFGLISVPEIYYRRLTERDEFIILATDGVWDVLSNKEAVDIVSSAPGRSTAARALVDCAVRAWRLKYPTSKTDDCAVVCLFLEKSPPEAVPPKDTEKPPAPLETLNVNSQKEESTSPGQEGENPAEKDTGMQGIVLDLNTKGPDEIVPASETEDNNKPAGIPRGQSKRRLADCLSTAEEEEWSALEGVTRANSLLSIPRLLSGDSRTAGSSRRKWL
ncbi:hypothetical protein MLD38_000862 [Melastoma candidum]|uniref:Uncharacterized protein n=1 Tax=Melastoma candidum TaxID=119954 RepID=A0ACB9SBH5_9MYRT|nr:hypothetical protein MLD38_000862 [Melastoma candidum]